MVLSLVIIRIHFISPEYDTKSDITKMIGRARARVHQMNFKCWLLFLDWRVTIHFRVPPFSKDIHSFKVGVSQCSCLCETLQTSRVLDRTRHTAVFVACFSVESPFSRIMSQTWPPLTLDKCLIATIHYFKDSYGQILDGARYIKPPWYVVWLRHFLSLWDV